MAMAKIVFVGGPCDREIHEVDVEWLRRDFITLPVRESLPSIYNDPGVDVANMSFRVHHYKPFTFHVRNDRVCEENGKVTFAHSVDMTLLQAMCKLLDFYGKEQLR